MFGGIKKRLQDAAESRRRKVEDREAEEWFASRIIIDGGGLAGRTVIGPVVTGTHHKADDAFKELKLLAFRSGGHAVTYWTSETVVVPGQSGVSLKTRMQGTVVTLEDQCPFEECRMAAYPANTECRWCGRHRSEFDGAE